MKKRGFVFDEKNQPAEQEGKQAVELENLDLSKIDWALENEESTEGEVNQEYAFRSPLVINGKDFFLRLRKFETYPIGEEEYYPPAHLRQIINISIDGSIKDLLAGAIDVKKTAKGVIVKMRVYPRRRPDEPAKGAGVILYKKMLNYIAELPKILKTDVTDTAVYSREYGMTATQWLKVFEPVYLEYGYERDFNAPDIVYKKTYSRK